MNELTKKLVKRVLKSKKIREKYLNLHTVTEIGDGAYRITEAGILNTFLFVGKSKALLVDTGLGISGLFDTIKGITDLPLTVVATNGHVGAVGGACQFEKVYIHKEDIKDAKFSTKPFVRKAFFTILPTRAFFKLGDADLLDGTPQFEKFGKIESFDLGGRDIKIIYTPSHTRGSCCFVDSKTKIILTGEMMLPVTSLLTPHSATLEQVSNSFNRILGHLREGTNYGLLGYEPLSYDYTCDLKNILEEISMFGNDYTKIVNYKISENKKRILLYYPSKTQKRKFKNRIKAIVNKI